ncbi:2Fe-2S iron-sulfur cluster-binding protein [Thalassovita sp.]|jgi:2Fe-2S ferredoxin|uniref:2Fe-2S iron-sulfur cluster-binding protein n=1 Tax=Thalassovita sp. TaxID=1979401 RepID=UPI003B59E60E
MPKVTYVEFDGTQREVELPAGWSLMQGATLNGVDGIEGECGGSCGCATCHCYVDEPWMDKLSPMSETEDDMLDCTESPREENSRLSCQIQVTPEMDGIVIRLPEVQS